MTLFQDDPKNAVENGAAHTARPLVSVVTIAKDNRLSFINTAHSMRDQYTHDPSLRDRVQWIVINGSTKGDAITILMEDDYADMVDVTQNGSDKGLYNAMNRGLDAATGQYVTFMNAGDRFAYNDTLQTMVQTLERFPETDFLYGDYYSEEAYREAQIVQPLLTKMPLWMPTSHQSMVYKSDVIGDMRYDEDYKIAGDYDFTMRYLKKTQNPLHIPEALSAVEANGCSQARYIRSSYEMFCIRKAMGMDFADNAKSSTRAVVASALKRNVPALFDVLKENAHMVEKMPEMSSARPNRLPTKPVFPDPSRQ